MRFMLPFLLLSGFIWPTSAIIERTVTDRPDDLSGYQVQVLYVLPADGVDESLDTNGTIETSVAAFQNWLAEFSGGQNLRLDTYQGQLDIVFVRLRQTNAQLATQGLYIRDAIEAELMTLGFHHPQKIYAVYYGGTAKDVCGGGAWPTEIIGRVGAIYLKGKYGDPNIPDCGSISLAADANSPGYFEFAILHELFHTLGAVQPCAANHTERGHTSDDADDLMYTGDEPWGYSALDTGNDDYFGHENPACYDLQDSVFLTPTVENPVLPPGWSEETDKQIITRTASDTCATAETALTTIYFWNTRKRPVNIYWVDYDCQEQLYSELPAGVTYRQGAYLSQPWRVRDAATGELLLETIPQVWLPYTVAIDG